MALRFTSLLSPLTTLIAAPEFLLNALASNGFQRSYEFHYVAGEVPFLFAGAVLGIARLHSWLTRGRRARAAARTWASVGTLATVVLATALVANFFLGPLPFSLPGAHYSGKSYAVTGHAKVLDMALKLIPSAGDVTVSTENDTGSRLSARRVVYTFPTIKNAQWVVVDTTEPDVYDHYDALGHSQALGALVLNQDYRSVYARDGVYVFKRVTEPAAAPAGKAAPSPAATPRAKASSSATSSSTP